jgi:hypothetical protein
VYDVARENIQWRSDRQKRNYDLKSHIKRYEPGEAVWVHNPARKKGISPKLSRPWEGPFLVTKRLSDVTYRVQRGSKAKPKVVHFDRLKVYQGNNPPTWKIKGVIETVEINEEIDLDETVLYDIPEHIGVEAVDVLMSDMEDVVEDDINETIIYEVPDHIGQQKEVELTKNSKNPTNNVYCDESVRRSKRTIQKPSRYRNE